MHRIASNDCQKQAIPLPSQLRTKDGWQSGRLRTPGKRVYRKVSGVRIPPHPPVRRLSDNKIPLLCRPPMKTNNVDSMNQKGYQKSMGGTLLQPRKKSPVTLQQARNQFRKHNPAHPKSLDKFWPSKEQMESRGRIWQVWVNQTLKHPST